VGIFIRVNGKKRMYGIKARDGLAWKKGCGPATIGERRGCGNGFFLVGSGKGGYCMYNHVTSYKIADNTFISYFL
jgi:hypothetical protein